jgi:phage N-6-adenine-methyltransferase
MAIKKRSILYQSTDNGGKDNWATPPDLFAKLHYEFHFTLDVCAEAWNRKLPRYFDKAADGLKQEWTGVCWMNPPYGRAIGKWMRKAMEQAKAGATVICLVPAKTDTKWWIDTCPYASEIRWFNGRIKFVNPETGQDDKPAGFPSALVIFRPPVAKPETATHRRIRKVVLGKEARRAGWTNWFTSGLVRENPAQLRLAL